MVRIGSHVPARNPLDQMARRGGEIVQLHVSAPLQWRAPRGRDDAPELAASGAVSTVHAPYLCNPASGDAQVRERTAVVLQQTLDAAATVGAGAVIVHAGHATDGAGSGAAIERWVVLAQRLRSDVPLLIENTATGSAAAGRTLEQWTALFTALRRVSFDLSIAGCLDTCHAFAGDGDAAAGPEEWAAAAIQAAGSVPVLHVNDSLAVAGGRRDLHTNLGSGQAGHDWLARFVRTCVALGARDLLVETPGHADAQAADIAWLRTVLDDVTA